MVGFAAAPTSESSFVHPLTTTTGYVYFNESGLPSGTSWSVLYNSLNLSSTSNSIKFSETVNLYYTYTVHTSYSGVTAYTPSPSSGSAKAPSSVSVSFSGSTFTANLTTNRNPTDEDLKTWYYSDPSGPAPSGSYYVVFPYIDGVNTTSMSVSSNGVVYDGYYLWSGTGSHTIYFFYHVSGTSLGFDSSTLSVTVNPDPTVSVSASATTIDSGQSVTFSSTVSGGTSPFTYQWYLNGTAVSGETSSAWTTTTLPTGSPTINVSVTDSAGYTVKSNVITEIVNPRLVVTFSSSQNPIDYGMWVTFNSTVTGGTPPYTYQWQLNGQNVSGATNSTWSTNSLPVGSDVIGLVVRDSAGDPSHDSGINASQPTIILMKTPDNAPIYPGDPFSLSVSLVGVQFVWNGNFSAYSFQWFVNNESIPGATNSSITTFQNTPGIYDYKVRIIANVGRGALYKGAFFGRAIIVVTDNLSRNSVKFVESGLPVGSYWSAAFIVFTKNTSYPYGTTFQDPLGLIFKVTGNGLPAIIIHLPNGTWTFYVQSDVYNNTTHNFESNAFGFISGPWVANISSGVVTMPYNSANGSVIIHIGFTLIGTPSNNPSNQTSTGTATVPLKTSTSNSSIKLDPQSNNTSVAIMPTMPQNTKVYDVLSYLVGPAAAGNILQNVSKHSAAFLSLLVLSIIGAASLVTALVIKRFDGKKQRDREVNW
jgi:hypothetical protein